MGAIKTIKRLAADILDVGRNRVRIKTPLSENEQKQIDESITRLNVKDLITDKLVTIIDVKGRKKKEKKKRKTRGKRKGKKYATISEKTRWMERVRAQRKYLLKLLEDGTLEKSNKRKIYLKIKGGSFRSKQAMYAYLKDNKLVKE